MRPVLRKALNVSVPALLSPPCQCLRPRAGAVPHAPLPSPTLLTPLSSPLSPPTSLPCHCLRPRGRGCPPRVCAMHVCVHASVTAVTDSCSEQSRSQRGRCSRAPTPTGWRLSWCCRRSTRASCVWSAPCRGGTSILRAWLSRYGAASCPLPSVPAFFAPRREPSVPWQGSEVREVQGQRVIPHSRAQDPSAGCGRLVLQGA